MRAWALLVALCGVLLIAAPAASQGLADVSGSIDVSAVDSEVDGESQDTLRQIYALNFYRRLTSYIEMRLGVRYYDFDLDIAEAFGTFQEEIQPTGEFMWLHPLFEFTASGSRRISRSPAISGKLISDSALLTLESAWRRNPRVKVLYEYRDEEETGSAGTRDLTNHGLVGTIEYTRKHENFRYDLGRRWTDNVIRGVETTETSQRLQYRGDHDLTEDKRWHMSSQYRYNRVDTSAEVETGARFLELVDPAQGLAAVDATPDQGPLQPVPGLIDGNTLSPVLPPVEIGAGLVDRNIGVDLGVRRDRVAALYVYTDRLSSATVTWSVWVSDDNLIWDTSSVTSVRYTFNPTIRRYEVEFDEVSTRFVKVVNGGVNTVPDVQVTEVQVFESRPETGTVEDELSSHFADARFTWRTNEKWTNYLDLVGRLEPPTGSVQQRLEYSYGLRSRYESSDEVAHVLRWTQQWLDEEGDLRDRRDDTAGYTFLYDPLPTLGGSASASFRQTEERGEIDYRAANGLITANATPWRTVYLTADLGATHTSQPVTDLTDDAWRVGLSVDTDITRRLRATARWAHRENRTNPGDRLRVRRTVGVSGELQVTNTLFGRAELEINDDESYYRGVNFLVSWRMFTKLLLSAQYRDDQLGGASYNEQSSVGATLDLFERLFGFRNVTTYLRFSELDQRGGGGSHILSWQLGLRATF